MTKYPNHNHCVGDTFTFIVFVAGMMIFTSKHGVDYAMIAADRAVLPDNGWCYR